MNQGTDTAIESTRHKLRELMPVSQKWAYFDHAGVAPIPTSTVEAMHTWMHEVSQEGDTIWPQWSRQVNQTRRTAAEMLGASVEEIALMPSTTAGINLVAEGFPWQAGDNIVTLADEFPSNLYPWMNLEKLGVETRRVPTNKGQVDLDEFESHCDQHTRVISISWIGYSNGCRRDLAAFSEIARRHDALFFLDAIQGVGVFPLNLQEVEIDCLAADGHKWMLGPEGAGIAFVRHRWLEKLKPLNVGWNSVAHSQDFSHVELNLKNSAERYEGGTLNMGGFIGLGSSLKLLADLGVENVSATILDFNDRLAALLQEYGAEIASPWLPEQRSGIVSFEFPGHDSNTLRKHFLQHQVALNCRGGRLRMSAHAYNNEQDLQRVSNALQALP